MNQFYIFEGFIIIIQISHPTLTNLVTLDHQKGREWLSALGRLLHLLMKLNINSAIFAKRYFRGDEQLTRIF